MRTDRANDTRGAVGFVLSGGGSYGAAQAGMLLALAEAVLPAPSTTTSTFDFGHSRRLFDEGQRMATEWRAG